MKLDMFCEVEKPRPWGPNFEHRLFKETLAQAKFADEMGFDAWWEVEHHTAEEMSYSSAPEVMLAAISQQTQRMRIGHSAVLLPHAFNHPMRVAERAATLDLISDGRLELGFARSTIPEWRVFGIDPADTRAQMQESMRMIPKMWTQERFSWDSKYFQVPERPVIPKPFQKPHPPLWQAGSSPDSFQMAGRNGVGMLGVTLLTPLESMAGLLQSYRDAIKDCEPAGSFINNQAAVFTFVHCAETTRQAIANGASEAAAWYINTIVRFFELEGALKGRIQQPQADEAGAGLRGIISATPTATVAAPAPPDAAVEMVNRLAAGEDVTGEEVYEVLNEHDSIIIGDPETCRRKMKRYEEIGCDRLMCFMQVGRLNHHQVMDSIRLVGQHLVPYFSPK